MTFLELLILLLCPVVLCYWGWSFRRHRNWRPRKWRLVGLVRLVQNAHRVHDHTTELLKESGGTFVFKGPWFANMEMLVTADPANIHHILSKNSSNYNKGHDFKQIFDILGDGIFNAEAKVWEAQRKVTMSLMNHSKFKTLLERATWQKVEKGLIPVFDHFSKLGDLVDLQELFERFTFDCVSIFVLGHDPGCLSVALPHLPCEKAFADAEEALLHRHVLPLSCWKLLKWLQIGKEKKLSMAWESLDEFLYQCISKHEEEEAASKSKAEKVEDEGFVLLTEYLKAYKENFTIPSDTKKFLRDTSLSLMAAGRDTVSAALCWFFWLIVVNPSAEIKILEEIKANVHVKDDEKWWFFSVEESRKLVYLHAALCESLRLFPPIALQHKSPVQPDILPSGHRVHPKTKTLISFYSVGRLETIWGKDCLEFKPERWITEQGRIRNEPSYKFPVFNTGPRTCLGKDMTFVQMKIVAATIICNYQIQLAEGHPVTPKDSIVLHMKHGFKVRINKRNSV
ncbi:alkane hydroxylase MAH1-like [Cornus florida]|uniref:alkane hydroxylase MAH1-like n=1 Tax=Cornus florida TaxID=4283 RepID=UPI00289AE082|nr:alkane hydroxylase MAH1-like [Cornus florida]